MIDSKRLYIRFFKDTDTDDLFDYLSNPEVARFEPYPPFTYEQAKEEAHRRSKDSSFFAICLKGSNQLIGNIYFSVYEPIHTRTYILGYVLNPKYQRQGYATEACKALLKHAFTVAQLHRVVAYCDQENERSWKLLERIGMRREGAMLKNNYFKKDEKGNPIWINAYQYAILSEEFLRNNDEKGSESSE